MRSFKAAPFSAKGVAANVDRTAVGLAQGTTKRSFFTGSHRGRMSTDRLCVAQK